MPISCIAGINGQATTLKIELERTFDRMRLDSKIMIAISIQNMKLNSRVLKVIMPLFSAILSIHADVRLCKQ